MALPKLHPQIVYRDGRPVSVILDIDEFETLLEEAEMLEDIRAVQEAKKQPMDYIAFEDYLRQAETKRAHEGGATNVSHRNSQAGETAA